MSSTAIWLQRLKRAVEDEREACAKIAEDFPIDILQVWERPGGPPGNGRRSATFKDVAEAIRARSNQHAQHKPSDVGGAVLRTDSEAVNK